MPVIKDKPFRKGVPMRKYYDNLDDYTDTSPSHLMELTKRIIPAVIFVSSMILMFAACGALEVM